MKNVLLVLLSIGVLSAGDMVIHKKTGLMWQDTQSVIVQKVTFDEAKQVCKELKINNYNDWRIPTINELLTIVDYNKYDPAILDGFSSVEAFYYWSSTPYTGDIDKVWGVKFKDGAIDGNGKNYDRYVRCVRVSKK